VGDQPPVWAFREFALSKETLLQMCGL